MKRSLFLFPSVPGHRSGNEIAVAADFERLRPDPSAAVVFVSDSAKVNAAEGHVYLPRNSFAFRMLNLLGNGHPSIMSPAYLRKFILSHFNLTECSELFIGDINFLGMAFSMRSERVVIRLQNLYLRIDDVVPHGRYKAMGARFYYEYKMFRSLELKLVKLLRSRPGINLAFISAEERDYFERRFGIRGEVWTIEPPPMLPRPAGETWAWNRRFVWVGSVSAHKKSGLIRFIEEVYIPLRREYEGLSFLLIGSGTARFHRPSIGISGQGILPAIDFESYRSSLFVNPDTLGGGVKLKLHNLRRHQLECLSTPLGAEGMAASAVWGGLCVKPLDEWKPYVESLIAKRECL